MILILGTFFHCEGDLTDCPAMLSLDVTFNLQRSLRTNREFMFSVTDITRIPQWVHLMGNVLQCFRHSVLKTPVMGR